MTSKVLNAVIPFQSLLLVFIMILFTNPASAQPYEIYSMTMGPGSEIFTRWGHNAVRVKDLHSGSDLVFNYGTFGFSENFIQEFLENTMHYWLSVATYEAVIDVYKKENRSIWIQKLNLTNGQIQAVISHLNWNAKPENKFYKYHHFYDNCSTRVRDLLDKVLNGAITQQTQQKTGVTLRDFVHNATKDLIIISYFLDVLLNDSVDTTITQYDEMFSPIKLNEYLALIDIPKADGSTMKLVTETAQIYEANPSQDPTYWSAANFGIIFLLLYFMMGLFFSAFRFSRKVGHRFNLSFIFLGLGILATITSTLLMIMNLFSTHDSTYYNETHLAVFLTDILLLVAGVTIWFAQRFTQKVMLLWSSTKLIAILLGIFLYLVGIFQQEKMYIFVIMGIYAALIFYLSRRMHAVLSLKQVTS